MEVRRMAWGRALLLLVGTLGCSNQTGPGVDVVAFLSASPTGGAVSVATDASMVLRFSGSMMAGMERYVDLHRGHLQDPTMPMTCGWSTDRRTVSCRTDGNLDANTMYTLHMGGGLRGRDGQEIEMDSHREMMGGQWADQASSGGMHSGMTMGTMDPGWRNGNGSLGMMFEFRTR